MRGGEGRTTGVSRSPRGNPGATQRAGHGVSRHQERSAHDRRQTRVRLSQKALDLTARIDQLYQRNAEELAGTMAEDQLKNLNGVLLGLERYWSSLIKYDPTYA